MATKKKTTTRRTRSARPASATALGTQVGAENDDDFAAVAPSMGHTFEGSEQSSAGIPSQSYPSSKLPIVGVWTKVKKTVTDYPVLAVLGIAGIAVTVALASRD